MVVDAGVYPLRTIWQEGGGGANIEIYQVNPDGTRLLINDTGAYKSYRIGTAPNKPTEVPHFTSIKLAGANVVVEWTGGGTLQAAPAVTGPWQDVPAAVSPYTLNPNQGMLFGRLRQ